MKRIAAVLMSVVLCLSLPGCAKSPDDEQGIKPAPDFVPLNEVVEGRKNIYLIVKVLENSSYWEVIIDGARMAVTILTAMFITAAPMLRPTGNLKKSCLMPQLLRERTQFCLLPTILSSFQEK